MINAIVMKSNCHDESYPLPQTSLFSPVCRLRSLIWIARNGVVIYICQQAGREMGNRWVKQVCPFCLLWAAGLVLVGTAHTKVGTKMGTAHCKQGCPGPAPFLLLARKLENLIW